MYEQQHNIPLTEAVAEHERSENVPTGGPNTESSKYNTPDTEQNTPIRTKLSTQQPQNDSKRDLLSEFDDEANTNGSMAVLSIGKEPNKV